MPRTRVPMNISFPTEEEKAWAIAYCGQKKTSVSEYVQQHFRRLRHRSNPKQ